MSESFLSHLRIISDHFSSGNWEVTSEHISIEKRLNAKYRQSATEFAIHRVAGSGHSLPIDEEFRSPTIDLLGKASLAEQPNLRFNDKPLNQTYDQLLRVLDQLRRAAKLSPEGRELLVHAQRDFDLARTDRGLDFPAFASDTVPPYDVEGEWLRSSQRLEQSGRCNGEVSAMGGSEEIEANLTFYPQALEVEIVRPWLSYPLLDLASQLDEEATRQFFSPTGGLRLIPHAMWILQTDAIELDVDSSSEANLSQWIKDNICCKIKCLDKAYVTNPSSLRTIDGVAHGLLTTPKQQLFAVISRRRH